MEFLLSKLQSYRVLWHGMPSCELECSFFTWHAAFGVAWSVVACYGYLWWYFQYWWVLLTCLRELQWELNNLTRTWHPVSQCPSRKRWPRPLRFKWTQWQWKLHAQSSEHGTRMVTYNDTNTNGLGVLEDCSIHIDLRIEIRCNT